jgi:hypothetical protein
VEKSKREKRKNYDSHWKAKEAENNVVHHVLEARDNPKSLPEQRLKDTEEL